MRDIDCLPRQQPIDYIREWLGLKLSAYEVERRRVIALNFEWPSLNFKGRKPQPPPAPPPKRGVAYGN